MLMRILLSGIIILLYYLSIGIAVLSSGTTDKYLDWWYGIDGAITPSCLRAIEEIAYVDGTTFLFISFGYLLSFFLFVLAFKFTA